MGRLATSFVYNMRSHFNNKHWNCYYADDILLLSTTLSGLQKVIDTCISYGNNNYIKHNPDKTEFLISDKQQIYNCHINLSNNEINLLSRLRHLGFIWDTEKSNLASLNHVNMQRILIKKIYDYHKLSKS